MKGLELEPKWVSKEGICGFHCTKVHAREEGKIKDYLIRAYSMRNCIVHGSDILEANPFEVVEEISDYLRASIIRFLE